MTHLTSAWPHDEGGTRRPPSKDVHDVIEVELVRSLFATTIPSLIMSVGFVLCSSLIWIELRTVPVLAAAIVAALATAWRMTFLLRSVATARSPALNIVRARSLERRFAASYIAFAAALGLFGAIVLASPRPDAHVLMLCLLIGYAAGAAAVAGLRPRIATASMLAAILPAVGMLSLGGSAISVATAAMLFFFVTGGIHSLRQRHRHARAEIGRRITFAALARRDDLTGLPNRLALREWFEANHRPLGDGLFTALHCLDLNGLKPVNDRFGHATGDRLIGAVSARLAGEVGDAALLARLGGDEFAIGQSALPSIAEARTLAKRLCAALEAPFAIDGREFVVSASIGYVTSDDASEDLEQLLARADDAMYRAKQGNRRIVRHLRRSMELIKPIAA